MKTSNLLLGVAEEVKPLFPRLERDLLTAKMDRTPEEHLAESIKRSLQFGPITGIGIAAIGFNTDSSLLLNGGLLLAPIITILAMVTFAYRPRIKTKKRTRKLERDLPYALRDILIEIRSGVSLYNAFKSSTSGYGQASEEFEQMIRDIDGGLSMTEAIEKSIIRNPSQQYRRAMWQISNSIQSGSDISVTLDSIVDSIVKEQKLKIKKYGQELNPYVLVYLLIAVISPSLGITGLIVISSFTDLGAGKNTFYMMLFFMVVMSTFFLNLMKSKRPEVKA